MRCTGRCGSVHPTPCCSVESATVTAARSLCLCVSCSQPSPGQDRHSAYGQRSKRAAAHEHQRPTCKGVQQQRWLGDGRPLSVRVRPAETVLWQAAARTCEELWLCLSKRACSSCHITHCRRERLISIIIHRAILARSQSSLASSSPSQAASLPPSTRPCWHHRSAGGVRLARRVRWSSLIR